MKEGNLNDSGEDLPIVGDAKSVPFEFRALEACLESACRCLEAEVNKYICGTRWTLVTLAKVFFEVCFPLIKFGAIVSISIKGLSRYILRKRKCTLLTVKNVILPKSA